MAHTSVPKGAKNRVGWALAQQKCSMLWENSRRLFWGNSPRHPERSEGSPANGTYLKIVPLHGDPSSQAARDDVGSIMLGQGPTYFIFVRVAPGTPRNIL